MFNHDFSEKFTYLITCVDVAPFGEYNKA